MHCTSLVVFQISALIPKIYSSSNNVNLFSVKTCLVSELSLSWLFKEFGKAGMLVLVEPHLCLCMCLLCLVKQELLLYIIPLPEVGRNLKRSSSPTPWYKQGRLEQVVQGHIYVSFENLQGWIFKSLFKQSFLFPS